jgi:hypothetical protein
MNKQVLPIAMIGLLGGAVVPFGCNTESYCFDCPEGQPSSDDAGVEASGGSGGTTFIEAGNGDGTVLDGNDCGADLDTDPANCGWCGHVCEIANAFATCEAKFCVIDRCASGFYDINGAVDDGCEYECEPIRDANGDPLPEESVCDLQDDDCDGLIDEVFDTDSDLQHCGGCNQACSPPANSTMKCINGTCEFDACFDGYEDVDGDINPQSIADGTTNGCECNALGLEACNYNDDDCDGEVDEGFDLTSDIDNCGACQNACGDIYENAVTTCETSACVFGGCLQGYYDIDGELATGCEYQCTPADPPTETCNGADDDCNGFIDDGVLPGVGDPCGSDVGACELGAQQCIGGSLTCVGDVQPTGELCDGINNDCDGDGADEDCPTATTPVRLDVGGSPTGDHSTTQLSVASQGNATFAAYLDRRSGNADIRLNHVASPTGTWLGTDLVVAGTAANEVEPWVFASPTNVYVTYGLFVSGGVRRIQLARTTISPGTWTLGQAQKTTPAAADSFYVRGVVAGQSGGSDQLVLVWQVLNGDARDIYLQASSDGGASWLTADMRVNEVSGKAELPTIATDGQGNAFVAWRDLRSGQPEVFVEVYDVAANTMQGNQRVSGTNPTKSPVIAADGQNNVHVAWTELPSTGQKAIRVATSTNGGSAFGAGVIVNTPAFADADTPDIIARSGRAIAAWEDNRSGLSDIYVNVWSGGSWRAAASRADGGPRGAYRSTRPKVAFGSGNRVFVTYQEYRGTGSNDQADVHGNFSLDGGLTFQPNDTRVDPGAVGLADSTSPFITAPGASGPGDEPLIIWLDNLDGAVAAPNADVYAARLNFP